MVDAYEVNVAPHNFNGHLGSLISAHMHAAVPNFKVTEIDIDDVSWNDDIVARPRSSTTAIWYCRMAPAGAPM
jgi:galactonate dehydratase